VPVDGHSVGNGSLTVSKTRLESRQAEGLVVLILWQGERSSITRDYMILSIKLRADCIRILLSGGVVSLQPSYHIEDHKSQ
jgi:hypothetical protein